MLWAQIVLVIFLVFTFFKFFIWDLHEDKSFKDDKPLSIACFLFLGTPSAIIFSLFAGQYSLLTGVQGIYWVQLLNVICTPIAIFLNICMRKWYRCTVMFLLIPIIWCAGGYNLVF